MAKPMKTLQLHYPMIQFLIISDIPQFQLGNIRSCDVFRSIAHEQKELMDYNGSYTMMAKPMKTLQLHYPMIQFLITIDIHFRADTLANR